MRESEIPTGHRVLVVLVHHGDPRRLRSVQPTLESLVRVLQDLGSVDQDEVWRQDTLVPVRAGDLARRRVRQWWLERRWSRYLEVSPRWFLSSGLLAVRLLQIGAPGHRRRAGRQAAVELVLTDKHVAAWKLARSRDVDLLVVLEDDARWRDDSEALVRALLAHAAAGNRTGEAFIDLAGGLAVEALRLGHVRKPVGAGVVESRPATNTTCAYGVGRDVVGAWVARVEGDHRLAQHPSDWLINRMFMEAEQPVLCLHSEPTALDHGSFVGSVPSSIRP